LKKDFREPFGSVHNSVDEILDKTRGKKIITVGDSVSYILLKNGIKPDIVVYDKKELRKPVDPEKSKTIDEFCVSEIEIKNPPGMITSEAWDAARESLKITEKLKIFVDGEEDLLVMPFVLEGDENLAILYGLREQGFVLINVNKFIKEKCRKLLEQMGR
jgi:uncharacterized protein (UPF0218 family)